MNFRKITALLIAAVLLLAGCGGNAASQSSEPAQQTSESTENTASSEAQPDGEGSKEETPAAESTAESAAETEEESGTAAEEASEGETAEAGSTENAEGEEEGGRVPEEGAHDAPVIEGLTFDHEMPLDYADHFHIYYYQDGYKLIEVVDSAQYLVIPEGKEAPSGLGEDIYQLYQPLDQVYMAATGSMSFIEQIGAIDNVTMSALDANGWMIEAPAQAIRDGKMKFAGKYSEPDYEMMVGNGCDLAIESTMILHSPEVQEMIEDLGIPVFIDHSAYEPDAFGRIEWIKVYAAMFDKEDVAEEKFQAQEKILDDLKDFENTGKTVAFFAVNSNNTITARRSDDFIPNMIELAGGKYIFENLQNVSGNSPSVRISMEEFYNTAVNADFLVYNGTIEDPLASVEELIGKDKLFEEFKAVKEGNVFSVDKTWYQSTATIGYLITDLNIMVTGGDPSQMTFLTKVE